MILFVAHVTEVIFKKEYVEPSKSQLSVESIFSAKKLNLFSPLTVKRVEISSF